MIGHLDADGDQIDVRVPRQCFGVGEGERHPVMPRRSLGGFLAGRTDRDDLELRQRAQRRDMGDRGKPAACARADDPDTNLAVARHQPLPRKPIRSQPGACYARSASKASATSTRATVSAFRPTRHRRHPPGDDAKFATLREYQTTGAAGWSDGGRVFAVRLLQNEASAVAKPARSKGLCVRLLLISCRKQQTPPQRAVSGRLRPEFKSRQHLVFASNRKGDAGC